MTINYARSRQPSKHVLVTVFVAFGLWTLIVTTGMKLPYFWSELAYQVRFYVIFPLLVSGLCYFLFFHRFKGYKETAYVMKMKTINHTKDKVKDTCWGILGICLIPWGIAWSSIAFPAWMTELSATETFVQVFSIKQVKERGSAGVDLILVDSTKNQDAILRLPSWRWREERWSKGEHICVIGRTSFFGTVSDRNTRDLQKCTLN